MSAFAEETRLRSIAQSLLVSSQAPGATIAVMVDGEPALHAGVGSRDLAGAEPIHADEPFLIYSVTKPLLAAAAMCLVEQGHVDLEAPTVSLSPVVDIDPDITLRHLLNHTSGLPDYGGMRAYHDAVRATPSAPWSDAELLERTLAQGSLFAPGEGWAYSNIGYTLVRRIVARHGGGSLQAALDRLLFRPLGLRRTRIAETLDDTLDLAPGYTMRNKAGEPVDIRGRYHPGWVAHGVVRSTALEVARTLDALFGARIVSQESLARMREAVPVDTDHPVIRQPGYGLGLMVDRHPASSGLAGHAGGGPGYATAAFSLEGGDGRRVASVALVNRDGGEAATRIAVVLARNIAGLA